MTEQAQAKPEPQFTAQTQAPAKRKPRSPCPTEVQGSKIVVTDGQSVDAAEIPKELRGEFVLNAMRARLNDAYHRMGSEGVTKLIAAWQEGKISPRKSKDGPANVATYIKALAAKYGESIDKVRDRVNGMTAEDRRRLRNDPVTVAAVAKYKQAAGGGESVADRLFGQAG